MIFHLVDTLVLIKHWQRSDKDSNNLQLARKMLKINANPVPSVSPKKGPSDKEKFPLQIYNVSLPMKRLQMDIRPLLTTSSGNKYLLIVVDCFSNAHFYQR